MVPSPSNPGKSEISAHLKPSPSQASELSGMDTEQMFRLIDSILPFEACLYYQFLPLALEGKHLKLGMVVPQDTSALDYVRHILAYLNCSLKTQQIAAETHQSMLSAYLNYTRTSGTPRKQVAKDESGAPRKPVAKDENVDRSERATLILDDAQAANYDLSDEVPSLVLEENTSQSSVAPTPIPPQESSIPRAAASSTAITPIPKISPSAETLLPLEVQAVHLSRPIEFIATLASKQLLHELLGRVLIGGIGRLYFERQQERGRILWSQDGVLQSVLEGLTLPVFQGLIIELKRIVNLPLLPVAQPKQVEIERRYQQEALLLRLRVMPGTYGEEATLQVLRGVALKFYQRQQLERLSQDALKLAQQLQSKLNEIRDRSVRYPMRLEALPAINQLLRGLDQQLEALTDSQFVQQSDNSAEEIG
jgi:type II secretory ATPase GspE/PulE/Tfp pilus assembly ATPase PilB-like protein